MHLRSFYISVKDMDRALLFYEEFLGIAPERREKRFSIFKVGSIYLGLYSPEEDRVKVTYGDNSVPVFETKNIEEKIQWLKDKKMKFVTELLKIGDIHLIQFEDTEGNVIELSEWHGDEISTDQPVSAD